MARKERNGPPDFLSTHPGSEARIQQLKAWMPEALQYYRPGEQSVELLPSPQALDSPTAKSERELLKRIQAVNQYVEQQNGERAVAETLAYQLRLGRETVVERTPATQNRVWSIYSTERPFLFRPRLHEKYFGRLSQGKLLVGYGPE
jgi:predicted Zn-dependent protease